MKIEPKTEYHVNGVVVANKVMNSTVSAYAIDEEGNLLKKLNAEDAITDENGRFSLTLPNYIGQIHIVSSGGSYVDEYTGLDVNIDEAELRTTYFRATDEISETNITISPITELSTQLMGDDYSFENFERINNQIAYNFFWCFILGTYC